MSENRQVVEDTAKKIMDSLKKKENNLPTEVVHEDPMFGLQKNIISFFRDRIETVRNHEDLKTKVQQKLEMKVDEDELDFDQLKGLFVTLSRESNDTSESIIGLFKPTPGTQSPFAQNLSKPAHSLDDDVEQFYNGMSPEDKQKLDMLYRMVMSNRDTT